MEVGSDANQPPKRLIPNDLLLSWRGHLALRAGIPAPRGTDESQGPATKLWVRFGGIDWSRWARGGRQIASCEVDMLGIDAIGAIRAGICARLLEGRLSAAAGGGRLWSGAGD